MPPALLPLETHDDAPTCRRNNCVEGTENLTHIIIILICHLISQMHYSCALLLHMLSYLQFNGAHLEVINELPGKAARGWTASENDAVPRVGGPLDK